MEFSMSPCFMLLGGLAFGVLAILVVALLHASGTLAQWRQKLRTPGAPRGLLVAMPVLLMTGLITVLYHSHLRVVPCDGEVQAALQLITPVEFAAEVSREIEDGCGCPDSQENI